MTNSHHLIFQGDWLRESADRPLDEILRGVGDLPSRLCLSGLRPLGDGDLCGEGLL